MTTQSRVLCVGLSFTTFISIILLCRDEFYDHNNEMAQYLPTRLPSSFLMFVLWVVTSPPIISSHFPRQEFGDYNKTTHSCSRPRYTIFENVRDCVWWKVLKLQTNLWVWKELVFREESSWNYRRKGRNNVES